MEKIFIGGNVPSSKNSKIWTGRFLVHSKTTKNYLKASSAEWLLNAKKFRKMIEFAEIPYRVHFKFYRKTKARFDYINALQVVADLMTIYEYIPDDSMTFFLPVFEVYEYRKDNAGVEFWVE